MTVTRLLRQASLFSLGSLAFVASTAPAVAGKGESSGGLPQLDFTTYPSQIFWLGVFFVVLYIVFARKILPNISSTIEGRQEYIRTDLNSAEDLKKEAEEVKQAYEAALDEAHEKSMDSFSKVEKKIRDKAEASAKEFSERSAKEIEKTEKSAQKAKSKVFDEIDLIAAEAAAKAAESIIGVKIDEKYAHSVVQSLNGKKKAA